MKEQVALLIELQQAESEMNKVNVRCRNLPEEIATLDETFKVLQAGLEEQRQSYEEIQKAHREKEEKLKKGQEGLKKAKARLGEVKTNKEYQAVLKEIEGLETASSETEDEIISLLEEVDKVREAFKVKEKETEAYSRKYAEERKKLETELQSLDAVLAACSEKSSGLRGKIARDLLKRYEAIKVLNRGLAVVAVWKEICAGCYMNIPPQLYIELQRSEDLITCPNCNRIIYWYDQNGKK